MPLKEDAVYIITHWGDYALKVCIITGSSSTMFFVLCSKRYIKKKKTLKGNSTNTQVWPKHNSFKTYWSNINDCDSLIG